MKIIKMIRTQKKVSEQEIKDFLYRNLSQDTLTGLEYDDPKTIARTLKMFGIDPESVIQKGQEASHESAENHHESPHK